MKRIGIFGGTFNPVHNAHLIAAEDVKEQMSLDEILFIPSANPPHKTGGDLTDSAHRIHMLKLAVSGNSSFKVSDIELRNSHKGKSYTVETLIALRDEYKEEQVKFYLIIGLDQLIDLHKWKDPGKLFLLSEVIAVNRPGYTAGQIENDYSGRVIYVPILSVDISSTEIRNRIIENRSIRYLVPAEVENYIKENNLYK